MTDIQTILKKTLSAEPIRIVAIDGGGIYGLASATWIRQLCLKDTKFLTPDQAPLFAGISSGAINALLLAKEADPRAAVLSGKLDAFWKEPIGAFSHSNPYTAWLSLWGIGGWFGKEDFEWQLTNTFGDMRLGDLNHPVLICTFNWAGGGNAVDFADTNPYASDNTFPSQNAAAWKPKVFSNLWDDDEDLNYRVRDVVYCAATPPGWRAVRSGLGDAGVYASNPTVQAIAAIVDCVCDYPTLAMNKSGLSRGELLDHLAALSISDGSVIPHYWLKNFDFSSSQFASYPTNPFEMQWYPPSATIGLDASAEDINYIALQLLGKDRYHRLDAGILPFPTLAATLLSRSYLYKDYFIQTINSATQTPASTVAIDETVSFLKSSWWLGP